MRRGWTLHEMVISLAVTAGVLGLAAHVASRQLRFYRGLGDVAAIKAQIGQASGIAASLLWGISPEAGDIIVALDTALEVRVTLGTAVTCESSPGRIVIPAATTSRGNSLAAYVESPEPGDRLAAFLDDSLQPGWIGLRVASEPVSGGACALFASVASTWTLDLQEQIAVPLGTPLRFMRPLRLSLYRASDGRWYLGARDWNGDTQHFNTIQPVAGPLRQHDADPEKTGLLFTYLGHDGAALSQPIDPTQIAGVRIVTRGLSTRAVRIGGMATDTTGLYADSIAVTIALRNAP